MASSSSQLPAFQDIIKRGSASEPQKSRPVPRLNYDYQNSELSLSSAVHAANFDKKKSGLNNMAASEPKQNKYICKRDNKSGFSSESSPNDTRKRTSMTMPRAKVTATTPLEQKIALKKLRQRLNFDKEDEKQSVAKKKQNTKKESRQLTNALLGFDNISLSSIETSDIPESELSEFNSSKLNERLDQVRKYLKEATAMYVSISVSGNKEPKHAAQMTKLAKLIQQLRIQENGYLDLLQKTLAMNEVNSCVDSISIAESISAVESESLMSGDEDLTESYNPDTGGQINESNSLAKQQQDLHQLKEQQALLKKIVDQQKELQVLKDRQAALLKMQEDADTLIQEQRQLNNAPNTERQPPHNSVRQHTIRPKIEQQTQTTSNDEEDNENEEYTQKRIQLEQKLRILQEKKQQMDKLASMLKTVSGTSKNEDIIVQDGLSEVLSEVLTAPRFEDVQPSDDDVNVQEKIQQLNDVRSRLHELKSMVADYEASSSFSLSKTEASRDNRLHAKAIQQKQANTLTGQGGARLRIPNGDYLLNDLQVLQTGIEGLMDNRKRPVPVSQQKQKIDVTRNPSTAPRTKNTNQEKRPINRNTFSESDQEFPAEYIDRMRELQLARNKINEHNYTNSETTSLKSATTQTDDGDASANGSDEESDTSSALQWQDDPEFQSKVKKLNLAKKKLHRLQELVRVVQQSDGPQLPIDDLIDLTLSQSEDFNDTSAYGESEEEADGEDGEETCEEEQNDNDGEEEVEADEDDTDQIRNDNIDGESEISTNTDLTFNFAPENGLSDNERRYQGLLRKQRLELNYLLKERERLLESQQKLSSLATTTNSTLVQTQSISSIAAKKSNNQQTSNTIGKDKEVAYPVLTKAELTKQNKRKGVVNSKKCGVRMDGMSVEPHYGSEHEIYPPELSVNDSMTVPISNPYAVTEIRRQRELFEQKKKEKFVEKQRRKRKNRSDENQSDDRATYSIHSDIDEGVGFSMYSADVTTAATWGGSTEQSSSQEDSAVDEDYDPSEQIDAVDSGQLDDDFHGSHFDQPEEEEEEEEEEDDDDDDVKDVNNGGARKKTSSVFKVKTYDNEEQPRRGISWLNDVTPKKKNSYPPGSGSVTWSLDVSPPRSKRRLRQGNLTPAHKLIQDNKRKRLHERQPRDDGSKDGSFSATPHSLQVQLASMCTSLLRNEQTLLSMLQNQNASRNEVSNQTQQPIISCSNAFKNIQEYFATSNYKSSYQETLETLKACYERVEQNQLDMEYLRQQFSRLNTEAGSVRSHTKPTDYQSPWPNAPSLHLSSFEPNNQENVRSLGDHYFSSTIPRSLKEQDDYQKSTQTEPTLFEDPFTPMQQYSLFGKTEDAATPTIENNENRFVFAPVLDHVSPGAIGDRSFTNHIDDVADMQGEFPYRLRMSEYHPMSYQGFPQTHTGNVVTMSKMSLHKDRAETFISEPDKNIWPSFFKLAEASAADENVFETSPKSTSSIPQESGADETQKPLEIHKNNENDITKEDGGSHFSLFEALRDNIYAEVATLIAMNESRPHYLIELFRELQLLNSDYLRQRALYSIQELVTRFLTDDNLVSSPNKTAFTKETLPTSGSSRISYGQWVTSGSEQTPSESLITTDDESESQALKTLTRQMQNNEIYDYAEVADTQSDGNVSTPGSHSDFPFAADDLGSTVINLDEALDRMKSYEKGMADARKAIGLNSNSQNILTSPDRRNAAYEAVRKRVDLHRESFSESSVCDANETVSDLPQPSVDTHKLDRQIKAVMMDLIPFLNERIESKCNDELLNQIRNLTVKFASDKEPQTGKEEFGRFFHSQLDSILKDSLIKFQGQKLKDCGEDILIDVSEILFNELAFFRLMQDLDRPLCTGNPLGENQMNGDLETETNREIETQVAGVDYDESFVAESISTIGNDSNTGQTSSPASTSSSNAFVMVEQSNLSEDETESARQFVNVELSVSEIKPIRSSGSGEDDNDIEPSLFSRASIPVSSINLYSQVVHQSNHEAIQDDSLVLQNEEPEATAREQEGTEEEQDGEPMPEDDREEQFAQHNQLENNGEVGEDVYAEAENESAEDERDLEQSVEVDIAILEPDAAEGQAVLVNQIDAEEETEDDLPEADMATDDNALLRQNQAARVVLAHLEGCQELAGDSSLFNPPNTGQ